MTIQQVARALRSSRRAQVVADGNNNNTGAASGSPAIVSVSLPSNATNYVDDSGIGHVKVNDSADWSGIVANNSAVHIVYVGSGATKEILMVPAGRKASNATESSSSSSSHYTSKNSSTGPANTSPTGSRPRDSAKFVDTGSSSVVLVIVGTALALIAIVAVFAVVVYSRRNRRRRANSEDPSNTDEPFIVSSLPHQPLPELSLLDTDISPDHWLEGQYQYSPNMSQLMNSFNGTVILSDNNTTPMHHRLTVDAYPSSRQGHRRKGGRGDAGRGTAGRDHAEDGNSMPGNNVRGNSARGNDGGRVRGGSRVHGSRRDNSARRDRGVLDDISHRGRRRTGTTPIVLYDENSTEEHKSNSSRIHNRSRPSLSSQQQRQHLQEQQQQRRRDKYATRRR